MRRNESIKDSATFGKYLGDFYDDSENQFHSTVFEKDGSIDIYYDLKEGIAPKVFLTEKGLGEIAQYLSQEGYNLATIKLHRHSTNEPGRFA